MPVAVKPAQWYYNVATFTSKSMHYHLLRIGSSPPQCHRPAHPSRWRSMLVQFGCDVQRSMSNPALSTSRTATWPDSRREIIFRRIYSGDSRTLCVRHTPHWPPIWQRSTCTLTSLVRNLRKRTASKDAISRWNRREALAKAL